MEFHLLTTERLLLRKVEPTDASFVLKGYSNDAITKFMLYRYYTLEEVQVQMNHYANMYKNETGIAWLIESLETKEPIGIISIFHLSTIHKKAELGFWSLPEFWGKGFTTEAGNAVIDYCFNTLHLNRIEATVETEHLASIATIKKLGLQHEGTFKEYEINNGKFIDLMMFAFLRKEYTLFNKRLDV
jgi:ribosomal-protein-alanine N-acetyltransferase